MSSAFPDRARRRAAALGAATVVALAAGCKTEQPKGAEVSQVSQATLPAVSFVLRAPEGPAPTLAVSRVQALVQNPYSGVMGAGEEGRFLYVHMNCAYCHGFDATGGMGPDLTDKSWRYGGSDVDVFNSIYRGRRQGMPAWGPLLTEDQIWKLVAYVRTLGGETGARYGGGHNSASTGAGESETRKTAPNEDQP